MQYMQGKYNFYLLSDGRILKYNETMLLIIYNSVRCFLSFSLFQFQIADCQKDFLGYDYRGSVSRSESGKECLPWNSLKEVKYIDKKSILHIVDNSSISRFKFLQGMWRFLANLIETKKWIALLVLQSFQLSILVNFRERLSMIDYVIA